MLRYFASLSIGRRILWCYLLWYLVTVCSHFDPSPILWLNSLGIAAVIGLALLLSVGKRPDGARDGWQTFRLFLLPFCVSSFSSLIKGKGFILIFPPTQREELTAIAVCVAFLLLAALLRGMLERSAPDVLLAEIQGSRS
jgi:hypothetical protein